MNIGLFLTIFMGFKNKKSIKDSVKVGDKYSNWTIIENLGIVKNKQKFLVECSCENKTKSEVTPYALIYKTSESCGCKYGHVSKHTDGVRRTELTQKYPEKFGKQDCFANSVLIQIKGCATTRGHSFELEHGLETFEKYCLGSCFYCGIKPDWPKNHSGIDRVDTSKGYTKENSVPCCFACNCAKNDNDIDSFKLRIIKLYNVSILGANDEWSDDIILKNEKISNLHSGGRLGERRTDISKKYPESYGLVKGSYAQNVWNRIKIYSKNKKVGYELDDLVSFETYIIGSCVYCGLKPQFPHSRNGIDRVDSSKGYTESNCVSCCKFCNYAKNDYTLDEFKEWIIRIYTYLTTIGWNFEEKVI